MAEALEIEIVAEGDEAMIGKLDAIAHAMGDLSRVAPSVFGLVEGAERRLFDRYGGRYVRSGDLKASLTQPNANGAIREAHGGTITFGTQVWYSVFQRRRKRSAVLALTPRQRAEVGAAVLSEIMRVHGPR